jgi:TPR repeat protein
MRSQAQVNDDIVNRIREQHGTLDDFPRELANTVANVYYRFSEVVDSGMDGAMNQLLDAPGAWLSEQAQLSADVKTVMGLSEDLREIDKDKQPNLYRHVVEFMLDVLKYRITNAHEKTGLRRTIERHLRRSKVDEIPDLIERLWDTARRAAERGDAEAQFQLGRMCLRGTNVPQDQAEGVKWLRAAAENKDEEAQAFLAVMYYQGIAVRKDLNEASKWARLAAEHGDAENQYNLGLLYERGEGVPEDEQEAAKWYRLAAEQGHDKAQYALGVMNDHLNYTEAAKWYRLAAEQGHAHSQWKLARLHASKGTGMQDEAECIKWCRKAAEQGLTEAQCGLGHMYFSGEGDSARDYEEAVRWYLLAAKQGSVSAQSQLATVYFNGQGAPQDLVKAFMWQDLAASSQDNFSGSRYAEAREEIARSMTPDQIARARALVREWMPKTWEELKPE